MSQEDLINWVAEVWYADKLYPEMTKKSFKSSGFFFNSEESKIEMFIEYKGLLKLPRNCWRSRTIDNFRWPSRRNLT